MRGNIPGHLTRRRRHLLHPVRVRFSSRLFCVPRITTQHVGYGIVVSRRMSGLVEAVWSPQQMMESRNETVCLNEDTRVQQEPRSAVGKISV